jgi:hypothetical protein
MTGICRRFLYWAPRVLCIAFVMFISIFALDVFGEHLPFWRMLLALTMHLVPTFIMLILLALAWRWEWIGTVGFTALGLLYIYIFRGRFPLITYITIAGPAFLVGILFLVDWIFRKELRASA